MAEALLADPQVAHGLHLLHTGAWFEAHEELELAWRPRQGEDRLLLQALIQWAVGLEHLRRGNPRGAWGQWDKCCAKLAALPPDLHGLDLPGWRDALLRFGAAIALDERSRRHVAAGGRPGSDRGLPPLPDPATWPLPWGQGVGTATGGTAAVGTAAGGTAAGGAGGGGAVPPGST